MEWSKEKVSKLIMAYHKKTCLWDATSEDFKNRNKKRDAWAEIASDMESTTDKMQYKMKQLIAQFRREVKGIEDSKKYRAGTGEAKQSKWFAYTSLQFLNEINVPREISDSYNFESLDAESGSTTSLPETHNFERRKKETSDAYHDKIDNLSLLSSAEHLASSPCPRNPMRRKTSESIDAVDQAANKMNSVLEMHKMQPTKKTLNEAFGEMVGIFLDSLPTKFEQAVLRTKINQLISDAEMRLFAEERYLKRLPTIETEQGSKINPPELSM